MNLTDRLHREGATNWECRCGHTNWAIDAICRECISHRSTSEAFRYVSGEWKPTWLQRMTAKDLTGQLTVAL